jgi:hypothetical protein
VWSVVPTTRHVRPRRSMSGNDAYVNHSKNAMHDATPMLLLDRLARPPVCWLLVGSTRFDDCGSPAGHLDPCARPRPVVARRLAAPRGVDHVQYASVRCGVWTVVWCPAVYESLSPPTASCVITITPYSLGHSVSLENEVCKDILYFFSKENRNNFSVLSQYIILSILKNV